MPNWKKVIVSGSDASLNSLNVATALTASGLIYPTIDGTIGQVITTDGAGNLTLSNVDNTRITIKNVSGGTIPKGTPLFITGSGTMGNIAGVIPADAGNPDLMPAGAIAGETLADEAEGVGLINGFISGVDTSAFESGDEVFVAVGGGYTNIPPTGSVGGNIVLVQKLGNVEKVSPTNGSGVITGPGTFRSVPNIQPGYTWVGDADYVAQAVSTASLFVTSASYASEATSASYAFNSTSSSYALTASYVDTLSQSVSITGSLGVGTTGSVVVGRIDASNDIVAFSTSDENLKEDITVISNTIDKIMSLDGVEFNWKDEHFNIHGHTGKDIGVIAQQVQNILPAAVRTNDTGYLSVRYEKIIPLLIEAVKEQQQQINELKELINIYTKTQ
jgi:hypothetical protein